MSKVPVTDDPEAAATRRYESVESLSATSNQVATVAGLRGYGDCRDGPYRSTRSRAVADGRRSRGANIAASQHHTNQNAFANEMHLHLRSVSRPASYFMPVRSGR